jgi:hypothetical protein
MLFILIIACFVEIKAQKWGDEKNPCQLLRELDSF